MGGPFRMLVIQVCSFCENSSSCKLTVGALFCMYFSTSTKIFLKLIARYVIGFFG